MEPTYVFVTLIPLKLGAFNTKRQLMTVEFEINLAWYDTRIMFNESCASELTKPTAFNETIEGEWLPEIWTSPEQAGLCLELWRSTFATSRLSLDLPLTVLPTPFRGAPLHV